MIERGNPVPSVRVKLVGADGATDETSDAVLGTGLVVFFAVPGAFTPTCHVNHLPGFVANEAKLKAAGVDLTTPTPVQAALAEVERLVPELEALVD